MNERLGYKIYIGCKWERCFCKKLNRKVLHSLVSSFTSTVVDGSKLKISLKDGCILR